MNWQNSLTKILNIKYPIVQGPFGGGYSSVELASTVSNLGGMGSFGAHHLNHQEILSLNDELKQHTTSTYAINLWVRHKGLEKVYSDKDYETTKAIFKPYFDDLGIELPEKPEVKENNNYEHQLDAILMAKPPVFSFVYGIPDENIIKECKKNGIVTIGTATTIEEAVLLEDAGVNIVVATGFEAGGHRVAFLEDPEENLIGTFSLIPRVTDVVSIPVIAAGGVSDGRGIAAAFALGAQGVQIGTAFLACKESNASQMHSNVLFSPQAEKTVLTKSFTGRLARGTQSIIANETKSRADDFAPYPIHGLFIRPLREAAVKQDRADLISFWSGQSAPLLNDTIATDLFARLINEVEIIWNKATPFQPTQMN